MVISSHIFHLCNKYTPILIEKIHNDKKKIDGKFIVLTKIAQRQGNCGIGTCFFVWNWVQ